MSPVAIPAVEWFFGHDDVRIEGYRGRWHVYASSDDGDVYSDNGPDPIELIEAAYEKLYAEPARREIREEEK